MLAGKFRKISIIAVGLLAVLFSAESRAGDANVNELAQGTSAFTLSLYNQMLADNGGNIFFSPCSISMALGMAMAGAKGDMAQEMATTAWVKRHSARQIALPRFAQAVGQS